MGLISGLLLGMVAGIALMAGWKQMMKHRVSKRVTKAADIKLLGSLNREDLKKLCGDNFPEWISFPAFDQVKCLNKEICKMWPFVAEPKPRIDYTLKAVGGSLTAVPGLSDMINDIVNNIVDDMLQWPHRIVVPLGGVNVDTSELELRPQGKLTATVVKATALKNMEMIGKSDPYVVVHIRPLFKVKTKVIDDNLNPVWDHTFELIVEDKETQAVVFEVFDQDVGHDKRLGIVKLPLIDLLSEQVKELELRLLPALDMLKIKDKKDRGTLTIKVLYHQFTKDEQLAAMEVEKKMLEERQRMKEAGLIGSTMDALEGVGSLVGSGVGLVGSGIGAVGSGIGAVGSAGVGMVGSRIGAVGSGLGKASKFMTKGVSSHFGSKKVNNKSGTVPENDQGTVS